MADAPTLLGSTIAFRPDTIDMQAFSTYMQHVSPSNDQAHILSTLKPTNSQEYKIQLFDLNAIFKIAYLQVAMHFDPDRREKLFRQLDRLLEPEEWFEEDKLPVFGSFQTLLRLLHHIRPNRMPGLGMSAEGEFVASWTTLGDHLTIRCASDDDLFWSLIKAQENRRVSHAGNDRIERIMDALREHQPSRWFEAD